MDNCKDAKNTWSIHCNAVHISPYRLQLYPWAESTFKSAESCLFGRKTSMGRHLPSSVTLFRACANFLLLTQNRSPPFSQPTHHIIEVTTLKCNEVTTTSKPKTTLRTTVQQRNRPHQTSGWNIIARLFSAFQQCRKSYSTTQQCAATKYQRCRRRCDCKSKHRAQRVAIVFTYFNKRKRLWHKRWFEREWKQQRVSRFKFPRCSHKT